MCAAVISTHNKIFIALEERMLLTPSESRKNDIFMSRVRFYDKFKICVDGAFLFYFNVVLQKS